MCGLSHDGGEFGHCLLENDTLPKAVLSSVAGVDDEVMTYHILSLFPL